MRENNLLSPLAAGAVAAIPMTVRSSLMPRTMWGTDGVRVFTVDDGWGWIFTAVEHWNAECVGWHVCKRGTASPPCSRSGGLPGCMADRGRRGSGAGCGWITAPSIVGPLHQPDQVLGHPAVLRLRAEPRPSASNERFNRTLNGSSGRIRNIADRDASSNEPRDRRKERRPEPRSSSWRGTPRSHQPAA